MYFDISINWSSLNDPVMLLNNHLTAGLSIFNILHLNWNISHKILSKRTDSLANSNKNEMHFALIFAFSVIFCEIYFPPWFHEFFSDSEFGSRESVENRPKISWRLWRVSRRNDVRRKKRLQSRLQFENSRFLDFKNISRILERRSDEQLIGQLAFSIRSRIDLLCSCFFFEKTKLILQNWF